MRAGRRREDRRGAVGAVRPVGPGRPPPRLLGGTPVRPHFIDPLGGLGRFVPFELERWQSTWENRVRFNLSESGVPPLSIQELLGLAGASALPLLEVRLGYSQSNGTDLLRGRIAALYPGVSPDQVLVTSGSSEANFCVCWRLIEPGDKVAVWLPDHPQTPGRGPKLRAPAAGFPPRPEPQAAPTARRSPTPLPPGVGAARLHDHRPCGGERPPRRRRARAPGARQAARAHAAHPQDELSRARGVAAALRGYLYLASASRRRHLSREVPPGDLRARARREGARGALRAARAGRTFRSAQSHPLRLRRGAAPLPGGAGRDGARPEARVRRLRCGSSRSRRSGTGSPSPSP